MIGTGKPLAGQAARRRSAALACILACLAASLPARADLPPAVEAALRSCLAEDFDVDTRAATWRAAGWSDVSAAERPAAARSLAPWEAVRWLGPDRFDALDPADAARDIEIAAENLQRIIAAGVASDQWFALPDGMGYGRLMDTLGDGIGSECVISGTIEADDVAAAFGLASRRLDRAKVIFTLLDLPADPADRGAIVSHVRLVPDTSSEAAAPPVLVTPRIPRPATRGDTAP